MVNSKKILVLRESSNKKSRHSLGEFTSVQTTVVTLKIGCVIVSQTVIPIYSIPNERDVNTTICDIPRQ